MDAVDVALAHHTVTVMMITTENRVDLIDYHDIIDCITGALDAKDSYTANHSKRVSDMALEVCKLISLTNTEREEIHIAAHLHDIGKIGIPDSILNKKGSLSESEWSVIKTHSKVGADILGQSNRLKEISTIVLYHHERYDGKGYPFGVSGDNIPIGSKIISICDSIDAMTMKRSYRKTLSYEECYKEIENNLYTMYDPFLGNVILDNWSKIIEVQEISKFH